MGYSKARGWEDGWSSLAPGLCYIGWLVGLVSLWAQLVRVPRLCFWRVYPKALGSIGGCLEGAVASSTPGILVVTRGT